MKYVDGFVVAVPAENKEAYIAMAAKAAPLFKEFGALRVVECWADDVPDGKLTDFRMAVKAQDHEEVVFSWIEYPSKEVRDAANQKMMSDPRMKEFGESMPFDGKRMIYGGFAPIMEEQCDWLCGVPPAISTSPAMSKPFFSPQYKFRFWQGFTVKPALTVLHAMLA